MRRVGGEGRGGFDLGYEGRGEERILKVIIIAGVPKKHQNVPKLGLKFQAWPGFITQCTEYNATMLLELNIFFLQLPM